MKRAIGAIAAYEDPQKGRVAFLQCRREGDSYPGCVEKTWGGGAEEGERLSETICRELTEELRECLDRTFGDGAPIPESLARLQKVETSNVVFENEPQDIIDHKDETYTLRRLHMLKKEGNKLVVTLLCEIHDHKIVDAMQPMITAGVFIPLTSSELDLLVPITKDHKESGIPDEQRKAGKLGMFPDEIEAVRKALLQN